MANAPAELLLKRLRDGTDCLRARMETDEVNHHEWIKQWSVLQEKLCKPKAQEVEAQSVAHEVFDEMHGEDDTTELAKHVTFSAPGGPQSAAQIVLDEIPSHVVWDEEFLQNLESYSSLLEQLRWSQDYSDELGVVEGHMLDETVCNDVMWDERPADPVVHDGLLQQLASGKEYMDDDEKKRSMVELHVDDMLIHAGSLSLLEYYLNGIAEQDVADAKQLLDGSHSKSTEEFSGLLPHNSCLDVDCLKQKEHLALGCDYPIQEQSKPITVKLDPNLQCGLLQQLALGEEFLDDEQTDQIIELDDVLVENVEKAIFRESSCDYAAYNVFDEVPLVSVKWDEMPPNLDVHEGLVQQLDLGSEYMGNEKTRLTIDSCDGKILIHNGVLSLFPEHSMDATISLQLSRLGIDILEKLDETFCQDIIEVADMPYNLDLHNNLLLEQFYYKSKVAQQDGNKICLWPFNNQVEFFSNSKESVQHGMAVHSSKQGSNAIQVVRKHGGKGDLRFELCIIVARQWDPGISVRPWDPGIYIEVKTCTSVLEGYQAKNEQRRVRSLAVAWGQATFCGGGSVTPMDMVHPQWVPHVRLCEWRAYKPAVGKTEGNEEIK